MPILDDLTNSTREHIWNPLQRDLLTLESATCGILNTMAFIKDGAAGESIGLTDDIAEGTGRHYTGFDPVRMIPAARGSVKRFVDWRNYQADVTIAGTELEANVGITSAQLKSMEALSVFEKRPLEQLFNTVERSYQTGGDTIGQVMAADLWGTDLPANQTGPADRRPEPLSKLFDWTSEWHHIGPEDLGEWPESHPWSANPPNDLADDFKFLRNVPQVWGRTESPRALTRAIATQPLQYMTRLGGEYLCPVNPVLWDGFAHEFTGEDQGPVLVNFDTYQLGITAIKYLNGWFYIDDWAPRDEVYYIHVGRRRMNMEQRSGAGFQMAFWMPSESKDFIKEIMNANTRMPDMSPVERSMRQMGSLDVPPMWTQGWEFAENAANALSDEIELKYAQVGPYRSKNIRLMNLMAA